MDRIPSPFDEYIVVNSDERLVGCWYGVPVRHDHVSAWDNLPIVTHGLLLVTNRGLVHCTEQGEYVRELRSYEFRPTGVEPSIKIPFSKILDLRVMTFQERGGINLLVLSVTSDVASNFPSSTSDEVQAGGFEVHFLMAQNADLEEIRSSIARARDEAASADAPLSSDTASQDSAASPDPDPDPSSRSDGGPIRFHAEDDAE
ncbi:MAG: hypothetical protein KGJ23_13420 [Euryarchaeota archaeon]|nr:hypothetical protein [Euryarchaeota archaeon]MDE1837599.1 hypothetical protein [Euryarchaeota archaeon]MDE2045910.1 hypothetical protein [Thermoplasmata archaeon]